MMKGRTISPEPIGMGMPGELRQLKADGQTSVAELREFLGQLRGRSPQEVLGVLAASQLLRSIVTAGVGFVVLMVVFTVGPYFLGGGSEQPAQPAPVAASQAAPTAQPDGSPPPAGATAATGTATTGDPNMDEAVNKMGIGETKGAKPTVNPLESSLDNLLDDIK